MESSFHTQAWLKRIFRPPIVETFLLHAVDSDKWRIATVWWSKEELDSYRASVETPEAVKMFRAAGAAPSVAIFDVIRHADAEGPYGQLEQTSEIYSAERVRHPKRDPRLSLSPLWFGSCRRDLRVRTTPHHPGPATTVFRTEVQNVQTPRV